jgi:hypothetical protein
MGFENAQNLLRIELALLTHAGPLAPRAPLG